jgi:predicted dehydrogenase
MAFAAAGRTFDLAVEPTLELLVDRSEATARAAAYRLGFARSGADWQAAVTDPAIDLVAIATPNSLHAPIALAALAAGKPVYCEKPLAVTFAQAEAMCSAASASGLPTAVGFTYLYNPMIVLARKLVESGEIGEVTAFRGIHAEDFMASSDAPFGWRCAPGEAGGALADIGSHIIALARFIVGEIAEISGQLHTAHPERPDGGTMKRVEVDDQADAIVRFANGARGTLSASWIATGRKMGLAFEISGTLGSISFTQERFNELQLFRSTERNHHGFTTIMAGPEHGDYVAFCPAAGHQLGYNDLKTIEVKAVIDAVTGDRSRSFDFAWALDVERVAAAIRQSDAQRQWVNVR